MKQNDRYVCKILTKPEDMVCIYNLALLLNPKMSSEDYVITVTNACKAINYRQVTGFKNDKPAGFIAIHDSVLMSNAPMKSLNICNVATDPNERGPLTKLLFKVVEQIAIDEGYGNIDIIRKAFFLIAIQKNLITRCSRKQE